MSQMIVVLAEPVVLEAAEPEELEHTAGAAAADMAAAVLVMAVLAAAETKNGQRIVEAIMAMSPEPVVAVEAAARLYLGQAVLAQMADYSELAAAEQAKEHLGAPQEASEPMAL